MVVEGPAVCRVSQTRGPSGEGVWKVWHKKEKRSNLQEAEWLSRSGIAGEDEVCSDLGTAVDRSQLAQRGGALQGTNLEPKEEAGGPDAGMELTGAGGLRLQETHPPSLCPSPSWDAHGPGPEQVDTGNRNL